MGTLEQFTLEGRDILLPYWVASSPLVLVVYCEATTGFYFGANQHGSKLEIV